MQKSVDTSVLVRYDYISFWINKLFKAKNKHFSQNNSTLYTKDQFSSQLLVFFFSLSYLYKNSPFPGFSSV